MRIRTEKIDHVGVYCLMPEKQFKFFTNPQYVTSEYSKEHGEITYVTYCLNRSLIHIGFDVQGNLFIDPLINTKNGKTPIDKKEFQEIFELILQFLSSAYDNGFLDLETQKGDNNGNITIRIS